MTLDDFFGDTKKAWEAMQKQRAEEAKQKAAQERQQKIDELKARREGKQAPASKPTTVIQTVTSLADYIKLENIFCVDADGHEFERYGELYVAKDIVRNLDKSPLSKSPYQWARSFEEQESFLPSFALSCNILAALYPQRNNPNIEKVLQQYKLSTAFGGWNAQNTIVDYEKELVIHYPASVDFNEIEVVNSHRPSRALSFSKEKLENNNLVDVLNLLHYDRYVKQLTGLVDPSILLEIGRYFGGTVKFLFPGDGQGGSTYTLAMATWLGCSDNNLTLSTKGDFSCTGPARSVLLSIRSSSSTWGNPP